MPGPRAKGEGVIRSAAAILLSIAVLTFAGTATSQPEKTKPKHNHRYQVAQTLKRGLAGTPLENQYWLLEAQGHKFGVNPYLVAAIAGTESSFGAARCNGYNAWGVGSCASWASFATWRDAILYENKLLALDYLGPGATLVTVGTKYAACGTCWANATRYHMHRFGASGDWLHYPG